MPREWLPVVLARMFHTTPLEVQRWPADERENLLALLSIEGEVATAWEDLGPGDQVVFSDDDEDDE